MAQTTFGERELGEKDGRRDAFWELTFAQFKLAYKENWITSQEFQAFINVYPNDYDLGAELDFKEDLLAPLKVPRSKPSREVA